MQTLNTLTRQDYTGHFSKAFSPVNFVRVCLIITWRKQFNVHKIELLTLYLRSSKTHNRLSTSTRVATRDEGLKHDTLYTDLLVFLQLINAATTSFRKYTIQSNKTDDTLYKITFSHELAHKGITPLSFNNVGE